jgi:hypothetical protein
MDSTPPPNQLLTNMLHVLDNAVTDWWFGIWNPGSIAVVLLMTVITCLFGIAGTAANMVRCATLTLSFLGFALLASLVTRASELFSYEAWWHVSTARTITWFGVCMFGVTVGAVLLRYLKSSPVLVPLVLTCGLVGILLTTSALQNMGDEVLVRARIWEVGPAPLEGMGDIESGSGWYGSWLSLREARGGPDRGFSE